MVDRLSNLVSIFNRPGLDFKGNRATATTFGAMPRILDAPLRYESGKSQRAVLHPAESLAYHGKSDRHRQRQQRQPNALRSDLAAQLVAAQSHDEARATPGWT